VRAVVRYLSVVFAFAVLLVPVARLHAQVTATAPVAELPNYENRWDIYGGAAYSHFNPSPSRNVQAINLLGWNGTATAYFRPSWGIEASARGYYGTINAPVNNIGVTNLSMSEHLFLFGPTFRFLRTPKYAAGMHVLIGAAYGSFDSGFPPGHQPNELSIYNNKLAFGSVIGAFGDYNLRPRWAVRLIADYQPTRYGFSTQNEFAGSIGLVYKLGALHK
jgi:hypothetical protein